MTAMIHDLPALPGHVVLLLTVTPATGHHA